jgi:hypothetical protein
VGPIGHCRQQWRTQKFSKEGASAAYFSNFTAWLMAIMLCTAVRNMQQKVFAYATGRQWAPISSQGPSRNGNVCGCKTVTARHFWSRTRKWRMFSVYIWHFNSWLQSCILSLNVFLLNGMVDCQAGHLLE